MLNPLGIGWVGLFANDLTQLAVFYERTLGLRVIERAEGYCIFDAGCGALFELWSEGFASPGRKTPREQSMLVGFTVERLEPAIEMLRNRGLHADTEIGTHLGTRWLHFKDSEGNRFELKDTNG